MTELEAIVAGRLDEPSASHWEAAVREAHDPQAFTRAFAAAGRRLGDAHLRLSAVEAAQLGEHALLVDQAPLCMVARVALLERSLATEPDPEMRVQRVEELFRTGSLDEQVAVLRALPLLPDAAAHAGVAAAGLRTNATAVLAALACDNPFSARHFTESAFNQLVMKAVFYELPLARVVGLSERNNAELLRMARDFADERRAAGRPVPKDFSLIEGVETP